MIFVFTNGKKEIIIDASSSTEAWEIFETKYGLLDYELKT